MGARGMESWKDWSSPPSLEASLSAGSRIRGRRNAGQDMQLSGVVVVDGSSGSIRICSKRTQWFHPPSAGGSFLPNRIRILF